MTARPLQDALFEVPPPEPEPTPPAEQPKGKPRESDGVVAIYFQATGNKYKYQGPKDAEAWKRMRAVASVAEIEERWRIGLVAKGYQHTPTLAQLDAKWNDIGSLMAQSRPAATSDTYDCGKCGARVDRIQQGAYWGSAVKKWLCAPCFSSLVIGGAP